MPDLLGEPWTREEALETLARHAKVDIIDNRITKKSGDTIIFEAYYV